MDKIDLPENVRRLDPDEKFSFCCHPGVPCFTDCCRELDLALTPYDVLRLRQALEIGSREFLERFAIIEKTSADIFPQVFLTMVDDGKASCPFVNEKGCRVYADRPGACRTYPMGRAASFDNHGRVSEFHVLLAEPHCRGFESGPAITAAEWSGDQDLPIYIEYNDLIMQIQQHPRIHEGFRPDDQKIERYLTVLYDLDSFRQEVTRVQGLSAQTVNPDTLTETELLKIAIHRLLNELFGK